MSLCTSKSLWFIQVDSSTLTQPLWDAATLGPAAFPSNTEFVRDYTIKLLGTSFPNMTLVEVSHLYRNIHVYTDVCSHAFSFK